MNSKIYLSKISSKIDIEYNLPLYTNKGAVIVETREMKELSLIVKNHLYFLPKGYGLTIVHSNKNSEYVKTIFEDVIGINYINVGDINMNSTSYNYLLTSEYFWNLIPYQKTLIFQADSLLLRKGLELFEDYDYVGACWKHINRQVGNGGLSIRTTELMKRIIKKTQYSHLNHGNEDVYFSNNIELFGGLKPSCDVASRFSIETMFYDKPIGVHAIEKWLTSDQLDIIYNSSINEI